MEAQEEEGDDKEAEKAEVEVEEEEEEDVEVERKANTFQPIFNQFPRERPASKSAASAS